MILFNVFLKLVDVEDWVFLGNVSAEDERQGATQAEKLVAVYLLEHEDAVEERTELRGKDSGNVYITWTPVRETSPEA
ncbi:hypothetical protein AHiyo8_pII70350 (plasmid) [Arthrobacter sp. Hiyo8]|nr:hypothetical protein AHiyo8_pII70150 [Arthrobacter sp. Hiyo8]BAS18721.1 hypothetical protein AHiyo8_pII70260 [Arthrobacter sp. Hiyo8]BAS18730.1 hypothetical protein AHiyo8_pII70350 [Arthrobacter sp. Hiyo8]